MLIVTRSDLLPNWEVGLGVTDCMLAKKMDTTAGAAPVFAFLPAWQIFSDCKSWRTVRHFALLFANDIFEMNAHCMYTFFHR